MDDVDPPVAAQISQADIIERQAETIAYLKRQVHKGSEYKQLTKSKLKEAAARLKEYRLRIETLLLAEKALKQQVKTEQAAHAKTKTRYKTTAKQVQAVPVPVSVRATATQTDARIPVTRASQTQLSGPIERVHTMVDVPMDSCPSRKRGRVIGESQVDQLVPQLSRNRPSTEGDIRKEPLQAVEGHLTTFFHETSAALDAALAFSDSDDESGDTLEIPTESDEELAMIDLVEVSEMDDEVEERGKRERREETKKESGSGGRKLTDVDAGVQREIDNELASSSEEEGREARNGEMLENEDARRKRGREPGELDKTLQLQAISDEIDKELALSSEEDDAISAREEAKAGGTDGEKEMDVKQTLLVSIDDELDDEFAALETEEKNTANLNIEMSLSSSSDSDDSEREDSDPDEVIMSGSTGLNTEKLESSCRKTDDRKEKEVVLTPTALGTTSVTTSDHEKSVFTVECLPEVVMQLSSQSPESPKVRASTDTIIERENKEEISPSCKERHVTSCSVDLEVSPKPKQLVVNTVSSEEKKAAGHEQIGLTSPIAHISLETNEVVLSPSTEEKPSVFMTEVRSIHENSLKRTRRANEAIVDRVFNSPQKKLKGDTILNETKAKKPVEPKTEETRMKKSLALLNQALSVGEHKVTDTKFVRRTLTALVKQSVFFIHSHPAHVMTLCHVLADTYRNLHVPPLDVVHVVLGVFRTPRSRRVLQGSKVGLSWLYTQVLVRLMWQQEGPDLSLVDDCLVHLQNLLFQERPDRSNLLARDTELVYVAKPNGSTNKLFVAHVCALFTQLCQATTQVARARVVLYDLVRENPTLQGLYWAAMMVEVFPVMLKREFDDREDLMKDTLLHALVDISTVAAARRELFLHQSSLSMLHRMADALQMPELVEMDAIGPHECVEKLMKRLASPSVDYFELAKCLELCVAVFGLDVVTQQFTFARCHHWFQSGNQEVKRGLVALVGQIAKSVAFDTYDLQPPRTFRDQYVETVLDWLHQLVSTETNDALGDATDRFKTLVAYSNVAVELLLEYSAPAGLASRRRVLGAIVQWFSATPSEQLLDVPAPFLRRLRYAVVAARPKFSPTQT